MLQINIPSFLVFTELRDYQYTKTLDRKCSEILREAAREWVRAVIKRVPVQTGAAQSTLMPLSRFLGQGNIFGSVQAQVTPKLKWDRRKLGENKSTFEIRDNKSHPMTFVYSFSWSTDLVWYEINELQTAIFGHKGVNPYPVASAPWHSLDAGREAFDRYVNNAIATRLPKLIDYISYRSGAFK